MSPNLFKRLDTGDIVQHASGGHCYVVTANYGDRVTGVRSIDMTNPNEWILVAKADLIPEAFKPTMRQEVQP